MCVCVCVSVLVSKQMKGAGRVVLVLVIGNQKAPEPTCQCWAPKVTGPRHLPINIIKTSTLAASNFRIRDGTGSSSADIRPAPADERRYQSRNFSGGDMTWWEGRWAEEEEEEEDRGLELTENPSKK